MTAYTVYFASRSILYAETKIEAETPEQALERAMERHGPLSHRAMAGSGGGLPS
jgi:hypothetical protein